MDEVIADLFRPLEGFADHSREVLGVLHRVFPLEYNIKYFPGSPSLSIFKILYLLQLFLKFILSFQL